jgi:ring-1,2-phenylacetyl-CoA epoxidase subunit PaaD
MGALLDRSDAFQVARLRGIVAAVVDPEIPVVTIADLGILRDVSVENGRPVVTLIPTYTGCPAVNLIEFEVRNALLVAGHPDAEVRTVLSPAWTTDMISEEGREKLRTYGIAPPSKRGGKRALFGEETVACPRCGSLETRKVSEFGSTACKALFACEACREPFDYFKCI